MPSRRFWSWLIGLAMLAGCAAQPGAATAPWRSDADLAGDVVLFGKWAVGCNNLRSCTAIAPLTESDRLNPPFYVQLTDSGHFTDSARIAIMREGELVAVLSASEQERLIADLRQVKGSEAVMFEVGGARYAVPRSGFGEVLAAIGEWCMRPHSAVSSTAVFTPLPAARIEGIAPPAAIRLAAKRCPKGHMGSSFQAWRGLGGHMLWRAGCGNEGLNSVSFWYVAGPQGAPPTPVPFERLDPLAKLYNSWFEESTGYLRTVHYFGRWDSYNEDCGIYRVYAWGMAGMKLVEQRFMPQCGTGIGPSGWISTYRATVLNGPDPKP